MRRFVVLASLFALAAVVAAQEADTRYVLWYDRPAAGADKPADGSAAPAGWLEALPVGNGRLGGMVYGGTGVEKIQLNESSVWSGSSQDADNPEAAANIGKIRELLFVGNYVEAQKLTYKYFVCRGAGSGHAGSARLPFGCYQTLGDLQLRLAGAEKGPAPIELSEFKMLKVDSPDGRPETKPDFDDSKWITVTTAGPQKEIEGKNVAVYRAVFDLTEAQLKGGLRSLTTGTVDDFGTVYVNAQKVGEATDVSRTFTFDVSKNLRAGRNVLTVIVRNIGGPGGLIGAWKLSSAAADASGSSDYRRELNLDSAVATATFSVDGVRHRREVFASHPDDVIVVRWTVDQPGQLAFTASLKRIERLTTKAAGEDQLVMSGRMADGKGGDGLAVVARLKIIPDGGRVRVDGDRLRVENASSATLLISAATNYQMNNPPAYLGGDPAKKSADILAAAAAKSPAALRSAHVADQQAIFRRCLLDLGGWDKNSMPTDKRLAAIKAGEFDPALVATYFAFGRYLLIGSSRPGGLPANLQGIWADGIQTPWNADYHNNINDQMNYWPAEQTSLSDCAQPFFDLIEYMRIPGRKTAKLQYNARGWV
ncbi:MAG: glycoside hydrolase N-terminal domain-containing protein, partial [Tepidisphaeraceae bacterium]